MIMADEERNNDDCGKRWKGYKGINYGGYGMAGVAYFIGFIAAAVYFIQNAVGAGAGFIGFLKALVWPYFLVYNLLQFLQM